MVNRSQSRKNGPLAVKLLSVLGTATLCGGCLLPQDDQVPPFFPDSINRPPQILDTGRKPVQQEAIVLAGKTCVAPSEFELVVEDDSPTIQHKWFIDPNSTYHPTEDDDPGHTGTNEAGKAAEQRRLRAPNGLMTALGKDKYLIGKHRVEVVITDGNLLDTSTGIGFESTQTGFDENHVLIDQPVFHTSYTWFVQVKPCQ